MAEEVPEPTVPEPAGRRRDWGASGPVWCTVWLVVSVGGPSLVELIVENKPEC